MKISGAVFITLSIYECLFLFSSFFLSRDYVGHRKKLQFHFHSYLFSTIGDHLQFIFFLCTTIIVCLYQVLDLLVQNASFNTWLSVTYFTVMIDKILSETCLVGTFQISISNFRRFYGCFIKSRARIKVNLIFV